MNNEIVVTKDIASQAKSAEMNELSPYSIVISANTNLPINILHYMTNQSVLNAAASLVVKKRKWYSITSTLHDDLGWLLVSTSLQNACISSLHCTLCR